MDDKKMYIKSKVFTEILHSDQRMTGNVSSSTGKKQQTKWLKKKSRRISIFRHNRDVSVAPLNLDGRV